MSISCIARGIPIPRLLHGFVCVCVRERERERERDEIRSDAIPRLMCVCVCERERERERVCVCDRDGIWCATPGVRRHAAPATMSQKSAQ